MQTLFHREASLGSGGGGTGRSAPKKGMKGDPEIGSRGGRMASLASRSWLYGMTAVLLLTTIGAIAAVVGVAVGARVLAANVQRLDNRIGADRDSIQAIEQNVDEIEGDITVLNETMPDGNGTTFFDDEWVMAHGLAPSQQFVFNASLIGTTHPPNRREYWTPDKDGIIALISDIPLIQTEFSEDEFAIYATGDPMTRIMFDLFMVDTNVTRTYTWPNKDGAVALISDIVTLLNHDNQSVFLDDLFEIQNDPDTSKSAMFDASQIFGDKTFAFPNLSGTFVLTEGNQTVSDKTFVANSTWLSGVTASARFDVDALTGDRVFSLTDRDQILIGRSGVDWASASMGWDINTQSYSYIRLGGAFQRDRFMQFAALGSGSGGDIGRAGIDFSWFDLHNYRMYTGTGGGFYLSYSDSGIPTTNNDLGDPIFHIEPVSGIINFVDRNDGAKRARFDISGLTGPQTFAFPDSSGTLALLSDIGTLGPTFPDAFFTIFNNADNSKKAMVDASGISTSTTVTYGLPNANGKLMLEETIIDWNRESARFYLPSDVEIPTETTQMISPWSVLFDPNSNQAAPNSGTYVVPRDGYYTATCQAVWDPIFGGLRQIQVRQQRGGVLDPNFFITDLARSSDFPISNIFFASLATTGIFRAQAGDSLFVLFRHEYDGGGVLTSSELDVQGGETNTFFAVTFLGPFA